MVPKEGAEKTAFNNNECESDIDPVLVGITTESSKDLKAILGKCNISWRKQTQTTQSQRK